MFQSAPCLTEASKNPLASAAIIIPTCNAEFHWKRLLSGLRAQKIAPQQVLIIDSSSTDRTQQLVRDAGFHLEVIPQESFRHGATRQMAAGLLPHAQFLIYITQDAIPWGEGSFQNLLSAFDDPTVGAAYGRQLPREEAAGIERHARLFNYPPVSAIRDYESRHQIKIKAAFFSNSFAAYRRRAFDEVGGFSRESIVSEEVSLVGLMMIAGWKVAYQADATVIHSHALTLTSEFSRYFDIGVHHGREAWLLQAFGGAGAEGYKFVRSEMSYLWKTQPTLIPIAVLRTLGKLLGYRLGKHERFLPQPLVEFLSAQPHYWKDEHERADTLSSHFVGRSL